MTTPTRLPRREFLVRFGKGAVGLAVFGFAVAACGDDDTVATTLGSTTTSPPGSTTTTAAGTTSTEATTTTGAEALARVHRVDLGFVSAYLVARDDGVVVVDTGNPGSEADIEAGLTRLGLDWTAVGHVIFTHEHPDHIGSARAVLTNAASAEAFAGADDIPSIDSPRQVNAVGDGDTVFGLDIVTTPGHTPGHISVHDPVARFLVAGDALNGEPDGGGVLGPNPEFTPDMETAIESAAKLARLDFDDAYFGHGEPLIGGASAAVSELVASLQG